MSKFVAIVFSQWYVRLPSHKEWHQHVDQFRSFCLKADAIEYLRGLGFEAREDDGRRFAPRLDDRLFPANPELGEFDFALIREGQVQDVEVRPEPEAQKVEGLALDLLDGDWEQYKLETSQDRSRFKRRRVKPEHRTWS